MIGKFRIRPAVVALSAAILFVFFRVCYRVIFGGVEIGENYLPSLAQINLAGPFSHISLFGPVTVDGLLVTASSALPFALTIFCFGILISFIDTARLVKLLTKSKSPAIAKAFGISLATLPKLIQAAQRISETLKLRGGPKPKHLLVPVLGAALDRALALATQMELRHGTNQNASGPTRIVSHDVVIDGVQIGRWEASGPGLIVLTGPNGSGKTSLLRALAGLSPSDGRMISGELEVISAVRSGAIGYLPQDPRLGFTGETIAQEFELNDVSPKTSRWNLAQSLSSLSEGEAKLLAFEILSSGNPELILLDEPFDRLDLSQRTELVRMIVELANTRMVVVAAPTLQLPNLENIRQIQLTGSGLVPGAFKYSVTQKTGTYPAPKNSVALEKQNLSAKPFEKVLFENQRIRLFEGEIVSLAGANGSGKTSLLKLLISEESRLVPENFQDLFLADSLESELALSDKFSRSSPGLTKATFFSLLQGAENQDIEKLFVTHPRDLSYATSLALAIAIQVVQKPKVLLLDEPGKGFDPIAKAATLEALKCVAETGTAVLYATHDDEFIAAAHRKLRIENLQIQEVIYEPVES